jgi:hypothetical protein
MVPAIRHELTRRTADRREAETVEHRHGLGAQDDYDAADDLNRSLNDCYAAIRARVAAGGEPWKPK